MYEIRMPKLSDSMEEGTIIKWHAAEGASVAKGDIIADVESDKATMELEAFRTGTLAEILKGEDEVVRVGEVIGRIAEAGEAPSPAPEKKRPEPGSLILCPCTPTPLRVSEPITPAGLRRQLST